MTTEEKIINSPLRDSTKESALKILLCYKFAEIEEINCLFEIPTKEDSEVQLTGYGDKYYFDIFISPKRAEIYIEEDFLVIFHQKEDTLEDLFDELEKFLNLSIKSC